MGMKIRQESRVKTFFKKLFKISKRRNKDGGWKQLDKEALCSLSRESGLDTSYSKSGSMRDITNLPENAPRRSDQDLSVEEVTVGDIFEISPEVNQSTNKVRNENFSAKKGLKNVGQYEKIPDDNVNIQTKKPKKAKKNSKNKPHVKDVELSQPSQEQELLDIDLDLVLSSFPSIRQPKKPKQTLSTSEAGDNCANENRIRQAAPSAMNTRQVKVVVESSPEITPRIQPQVSHEAGQVAATETINRSTKAGETDKAPVRDDRNADTYRHSGDRDSEYVSAAKQTTLAAETGSQSEIIQVIEETPSKKANRKKKAKKQRKSKRQQSQSDVPVEDRTLSTEVLLGEESVTSASSRGTLPQRNSTHKYSVLESVDDQEGEILLTPQSKKKRNKRLKKKGNVRRPEDDLAEDLREIPARRPKHQVMWDPDQIVEEVAEDPTAPELPATGKKSKKNRRRRLKFKVNRDKKRLNVDRYDELCEVDDNKDSPKTNAKEVGRRMWRACKSGWKYLRNGLVFYAKSPAASVSLGPIVKRYDDEYGDGRGPFSLV